MECKGNSLGSKIHHQLQLKMTISRLFHFEERNGQHQNYLWEQSDHQTPNSYLCSLGLTRLQPHILGPEYSLDLTTRLGVVLKSWLQISWWVCQPGPPSSAPAASLGQLPVLPPRAIVGLWHTCLPAQYLETSTWRATYIKLFPELVEKRKGGGSCPIKRLNRKYRTKESKPTHRMNSRRAIFLLKYFLKVNPTKWIYLVIRKNCQRGELLFSRFWF